MKGEGFMRKDRIIVKAADMLDVPADVKGGLLHVEIESNREVFFENHKGIISLSEEEIEINSPDGCVIVCGSRLKVSAMNAEELRVAGVIDKIEFGRVGG